MKETPRRDDEFRDADFTSTLPGDWIEYTGKSNVDRGMQHFHLKMECVAADPETVHFRHVEHSTQSPGVPSLIHAARADGKILGVWRIDGPSGLERLELRPGTPRTSRPSHFEPTIRVLREREKWFRSPDPAIEGRVYFVESTLATPLPQVPSVSIRMCVAFSSALPFPIRVADSGVRARKFVPASWSENSLEPPALVLMRRIGKGPCLTCRATAWGRSDERLIAWGRTALSRIRPA